MDDIKALIVEKEGAVLGVNLGRPIVTNGDFVAYLCDVLFSNDFAEDLFSHQGRRFRK